MSTEPAFPNSEPETRKPFGWQFWLILAVFIVVLAGLTQPMVIRSHKNVPKTEAISNLRQIGLAMFEFETEYGSFPNDTTAAEVTKNHPTHGYDLSGTSSNAMFRQLFAAQITQSEQMFYAKVPGVHKPDGNIFPGHALEKGEVAFGCVSVISTTGNPARIVAFAPIISGTTKFDPKPFEGFAVVARIDNSVTSYKIQEDGSIGDKDGDILSPAHPVWGEEEVPEFHYPDLDPTPSPGFFKRLFSK